MPIVAIPVAAVAIGVAGAGLATAGLTVATAFAVTAAIGATIAAVGSVTKDRTLSLVGAGIGAVGAVGGLATSAGLFAEAGAIGSSGWGGPEPIGLATETAAAGADAAVATAGAASAADPAIAALTSGEVGTDIFNEIASQMNIPGEYGQVGAAGAPGDAVAGSADVMASSPVTSPQAAVAGDVGLPIGDAGDAVSESTYGGFSDEAVTPSAAAPQTNQVTGTPAESQPTPPASGAPQTPNVPVGRASVPVGQSLPSTPPVQSAPISPADAGIAGSQTAAQLAALRYGSAPLTPTSWWGDLMSVVGKPGVAPLVAGAVQAGGAFISGATSTLTPAQINALNAQAEANRAGSNVSIAQADLLRLQRENLSGPMPVASRTPMGRGVISAPGFARVTGVPA